MSKEKKQQKRHAFERAADEYNSVPDLTKGLGGLSEVQNVDVKDELELAMNDIQRHSSDQESPQEMPKNLNFEK